MKTTIATLSLLAAAGCAASTHPTEPAALGVPRTTAELEATLDAPGPLVVETINSADWAVSRAGLINLDHPHAAALEDGDEPIQVYFHVVRHPQHGTFIIDTGIERAMRDDPDNAAIRGLVASFMNREALVIHQPLGDWLRGEKLAGVFLTHLHLDHIMGLPDVPRGTPIYAGPGETTSSMFLNLFVQGTTDRALQGHAPIQEWRFQSEPNGAFDAVIDVFGDGSLYALWVPGHTPGSTAYLARTATGPILFTGDASHTTWGWEHDVEPGDFSRDPEQSAASFERLRRFASAHPNLEVRVGHQHAVSPAAVQTASAAR